MNVSTFWKEKAAKEAELAKEHPSGCLFVTSLENSEKNTTAGAVAEVSLNNAARLFQMGTHRKATKSEIEAHQEREAISKKASLEAEIRAGRADPLTTAVTVAAAMREMDEATRARPDSNKPAKS